MAENFGILSCIPALFVKLNAVRTPEQIGSAHLRVFSAEAQVLPAVPISPMLRYSAVSEMKMSMLLSDSAVL